MDIESGANPIYYCISEAGGLGGCAPQKLSGYLILVSKKCKIVVFLSIFSSLNGVN